MAFALEGIRVLDMSRLAPFSQATMYLADMGAEVIKIEATAGAGERARGHSSEPSPPRDEAGIKMSAYNATNRNKKSLALNLKSEAGQQVYYELAKTADIIFEGFRPGVTKRLAVDYDTIREINPQIIYCSMTGYGQDGPYAALAGHDINYIATSGALNLIGYADPPSIPFNFVGDSAGGTLHAVIAMLGALMARERLGVGQYVDVSMTDGAVSLLGFLSVMYFQDGENPQHGKGRLDGQFPDYSVYETKGGGYVAIGAIEPYFWGNLCQAVGKEHLFPAPAELGEESEKVRAEMKALFLTKTKEEWCDLLAPKNIPIAKVNNMEEVFNDPQIKAREMVMEVAHPTLGKVKQQGFPIKFSETPMQLRNFAPFFSEHADELLKQVGYRQENIERLRRDGVID